MVQKREATHKELVAEGWVEVNHEMWARTEHFTPEHALVRMALSGRIHPLYDGPTPVVQEVGHYIKR